MDVYLSDGASFRIDLAPEWSARDEEQLLISPSVSISGLEADYSWGTYNRHVLPINYLSSSDAMVVNLWWERFTQLYFVWDQSTYIVRIVGDTPFQSPNRPYHTQYQGTLTIERI